MKLSRKRWAGMAADEGRIIQEFCEETWSKEHS
jgi:hypothetical protein